MKLFRSPILFVGILILAISCNKEESKLDNQLNEALMEASQGLGNSYYKMPSSSNYSSIPQDPNNPLSEEKIELGKLLFHETAFATENVFPITGGEYSCASCHHAAAGFQSGLAQGLGEGGEGFGMLGEGRTRNLLCDPSLCDVQPLRSPTVMNTAYQSLMLWSGTFGATGKNIGTNDSWTPDTPKATNNLGFKGVETQAIAGLGVHRLGFDEQAVRDNGYKRLWDQAFGNIPVDERYTKESAGLAIAAYERTILSSEAPFQKYLKGEYNALTDEQKEGAILFFGKAKCASCHNGPALNDEDFHALGMGEFDIQAVTHYNEDDPAQMGRFDFTKEEADKYRFKTPQLYNLADVGFFGHGASFQTIREVVDYKNKALHQNAKVPASNLSSQFTPLGLSDEEVDKITEFLRGGLYDPNLQRYVPTSLPSGNCFPNNDGPSKLDLDCQ